MKKRLLPIAVCSLLLVGAGCAQNVNVNGSEHTNSENQTSNTQEPINYGVEMSVEAIEAATQDCNERGGTLNMCGSPCEPDAEVCLSVCALVCEFE